VRKIFLPEEGTRYSTLYDFTLDVGDSFTTSYTDYDLEVIASATIRLINGAKRRTWTLACTENPENTLVWIEGIGSLYGMLWPKDFCSGDYGDLRLNCYYVYERLHYMNPEVQDCITPLTSTDDFAFIELSSITVSPNPTSDFLTLDYPSDLKIDRIELTDPHGRTQRLTVDNRRIIDLSAYPTGLHYLQIYTDKGQVVKKVVIE